MSDQKTTAMLECEYSAKARVYEARRVEVIARRSWASDWHWADRLARARTHTGDHRFVRV